MSVSRVKSAATSVFHPGWVLAGIGVWIGLQLLAWILSLGVLGGLPSYFVMGVLIAVASPGSTIVEPGVAAFIVAATWFVLGHIVLSLFGVGLIAAVTYGLVGFVLGVGGGLVGEKL